MEYDKMEDKQEWLASARDLVMTNIVDRVLMNEVNDSKLLGWSKKD